MYGSEELQELVTGAETGLSGACDECLLLVLTLNEESID
jgi:hypothetical protein